MISPYISAEYRAQQETLHSRGGYGVASVKYAPLVTQVIDRLEVTHLLDYGAGKNMNLGKSIRPKHKLTYQAYDPCVPELAEEPTPAQMVACIDVLEHIEPDYLDNVLDHLAQLTQAVAFITIHTGPAGKVLPDGRNAHLIQEPLEWWLPKLMQRFELQTVQVTSEHGFYVIGHPKPLLEAPDGSKLVA
jgi:hypothetical protein